MESILVTGASRGLGKALFNQFWIEGYHVYPVVRKEKDREYFEITYKERCYPILSDVTSYDLVSKIEEVVSKNTNVLDIVINNAGIPGKEYEIERVTLEEMRNLFEVHCLGALNTSKSCINFLKQSARGRIINISSRLGSLSKMSTDEFKGRSFSYSYRVAKASLNMLTICLNNELESDGIGVVTIHPGLVKTSSGSSDASENPEEVAKKLVKWVKTMNSEVYGTFQYPDNEEFPW